MEQLKIGRSINDNLLLYQKDEKANENDLNNLIYK